MNIRVDVLDPAYAEQTKGDLAFLAIAEEACAGDYSRVDAIVASLENTYAEARRAFNRIERDAIQSAILELSATGASEALEAWRTDLRVLEDDERAVATGIDAEFARQFPDLERDLRARFDAIGCSADGQVDAAKQFRTMVYDKGRQVADRIEELRSELQIDLGDFKKAFAASGSRAEAAINAVAEQTKEKAEEVGIRRAAHLGDSARTLALSKLAYAAVEAPDSRWAERYNKAGGWGFGGSTDVAIKLNETADFSVKGLVFDARASAIATRKLTTSAVQLLAAGAGMPLGVPGGGGGDASGDKKPESNIAEATAAVSSAKQTIALSEQKKTNYRAALKRLAASVIAAGETAGSAPSADRRRDARLIAKGVYDANAPFIHAPPPNP